MPVETIQTIRTILNENNLFLEEIPYCNSDHFHSCRVKLISNNLNSLNIGTGGKGMSAEYSLASAYAEFMERLQNCFLISGQQYASKNAINQNINSYYSRKIIAQNLVLDFIYDYKEKIISIEQSIKENIKFYLDLFPFLKNENEILIFLRDSLNFDNVISIPFYSYQSDTEVFLPIEIIHIACGSNGMASGNTKCEALIQGFCEIFERYAGREIYYRNLTPPDIPLESFKGKQIYETIKKFIDETGYNIIIKDCSLSKGIPVLGALIIDGKRRKYNFNLGCSLSPEIALQRCFTEIFQNPNGIYWLDIKLEKFNDNPNYLDEFVYINGNNIFNNSTGYWPFSLFNSNASYTFSGLNWNLNNDDEVDLKFIINKIKEFKFDIYIRDVSFLGFPSYYIIVPGMSQFPNSEKHYTLFGDSIIALKGIRHLNSLTESEIENICHNINNDYIYLSKINYKVSDMLLYNTDLDLNILDLELLFFMLNYRVKNFKKALFYINIFLNDKSPSEYLYYYAIKDYVDLKVMGLSDEEIYLILNKIYNKDISEEIISDISDNTKIFNNYNWTNCFNCESCVLENKCMFFDILSIIKRLQNKQKAFEANYNHFL